MNEPFSRRRQAQAIVAYTMLLMASFYANVFWVPDGVFWYNDGFRVGDVGPDSDLVMNRLSLARDNTEWWRPLYWEDEAGGRWYRSQVGLQGIVLGAIYRESGGNIQDFAAWAAFVVSGLTALVLAIFFANIHRQLGSGVALFAALLTACTPILLTFATSLYWAPFLIFAPFVAAWRLMPQALASRARFAVLLFAITGLVGLKALCGYEYISTVILAPAAAVVYHRAAAGLGWRSWVVPGFLITAAGAVGFGAALVIHAAQIGMLDHSSGMAIIAERAATMSGGSIDPKHFSICLAPEWDGLPDRMQTPMRHILGYFWQPACASPTTWGPLRFTIPLGVLVIATLGPGWCLRRRLPLPAAALVPAATIGFLASVSWHILASTHTCIHGHLNLITYCVPFLVLAFALLSSLVMRTRARSPVLLCDTPSPDGFAASASNLSTSPSQDRQRGGASGFPLWARISAVLTALIIVGNALFLFVRSSHDQSPSEAIHRISEELEAGTVPFCPGIVSEYHLEFLPPHLNAAVWDRPRLLANLDDPGGPTRIISGWQVGPRSARELPRAPFVVLRDGRLESIEAVFRRETIVERKMGVNCTRFRIAVPVRDSNERLRLFTVDPTGRVVELTMK